MRRVILESPYAGDVGANLAYARAALRDSLMRGETPVASHLLYTQTGVLDDSDPAERELGISAGLAWGKFSRPPWFIPIAESARACRWESTAPRQRAGRWNTV